jgi:putative methyltransferase (TIGR04325 family)
MSVISKKIRYLLKKILPESIKRGISGFFYGWHGNYSSWNEAVKMSSGYSSETIVKTVSDSSAKVRDGLAAYERDSVVFEQAEYSFPVLSGLLWIAAQNKGLLRVLDFGGSLGSSYFQNKKFLDKIPEVHWCIIEQPQFVKEGLSKFSTDRLQFFNSAEDCLTSKEIDVILLSSVLQYIEEPFRLLENLTSKGIKYLIIDRTPFVKGKDRITIQKVHPLIYKATYPCWFFNKGKFINFLGKDYELIADFDAIDKANLPSEFKGFIFSRKTT